MDFDIMEIDTKPCEEGRIPMQKPVEIWIDTIDFTHKGGWKEDTQFVHLMGSGYLIAADIPGVPVEDATVSVNIPESGMYRIWVRDRNWLRPHNPGTFALLVNGEDNGIVLGQQPSDAWIWEIAGDFELNAGQTTLSLHDLTGYFGRCSSILITNDFDYVPPRETERFQADRARIKGLDITEKFGGDYDVIVAGGGPGGVPAAIAAARHGAKVLLIHNRPVLGGNASSEVGITMDGASSEHVYARESGIAEEIRRLRDRNPSFHDDWTGAMETLTAAEENLTVLYNHHVCQTEMASPKQIRGVTAQDIRSLCKTRFEAKIFIDCTGDGWMGYYAGAKFRYGREGMWQHNEFAASEIADTQTMSGCIKSGNLPFFFEEEAPVEYHAPQWVPPLAKDDKNFGRKINGNGGIMQWWLEISNKYDDMYDGEQARDALLMALLGYYDHIKNDWSKKERAQNLLFRFTSVFIGRRESRRFVGDYVLTQDDCLKPQYFPDAVAYAGWLVDVHHPEGLYSGEKGTMYCAFHCPMPTIPMRCLYSVNIDNLLFAGRNISTTHIAMGTTRVENTIATLGQAVGTAAAMCIRNGKTPRQLCEEQIHELQQQLIRDDQYIPGIKNEDENDPCRTAQATASSVKTNEVFQTQQGVEGEYVPLYTSRNTAFCLEQVAERLDALYLQLRSENDTPTPITVHITPLGCSRTNLGPDPETYTVMATVPPMSESWVKVPMEIELPKMKMFDRCFIQVQIDAAPGIGWRIARNRSYADSTGVMHRDGSWTYYSTTCFRCTQIEPTVELADCGAHNVINGHSRILDASRYEWVSDPEASLPQWLELSFKEQVPIRSVSVVFDTDLTNPVSSWHLASKAPGVFNCVKDYTVDVYDGSTWVTVADVQDNFMRKRTHSFDAILAQKLRITVKETWGDPSARIMEVRAE